ncbi:hypothetical protein, partial [Priestia megaterium]|uniref:hypothetical protein n=1 Tax=Priestia megaterium TaxID=1404 RepID=UPI00406BC356
CKKLKNLLLPVKKRKRSGGNFGNEKRTAKYLAVLFSFKWFFFDNILISTLIITLFENYL